MVELDVQKIASELIEKFHKQSRAYGIQAERMRWMAEGVSELHKALCTAAEAHVERVGEQDSD